MNDAIIDIIIRIEKILLNEKKDSIDILGSYIVGATIAREDYEFYQNKYTLLDEIAELGADLETLKGNEAEVSLKEIKSKLNLLKQQLADK
jgi:hypothetical protein